MEDKSCYVPSRLTRIGSLSTTSALLPNRTMPLMRRVRMCFQFHKTSVCSKPVIMCLLWELTIGLAYNLFLTPASFVQSFPTEIRIVAMCLLALIFLISPLAGYLADVKFGRFNLLLKSSYLMLGSVICFVFILILLTFRVHSKANYHFYTFLALLIVIALSCACGRMIFIANFLQFVMDQLRDAPTQDSVLFLYLYW